MGIGNLFANVAKLVRGVQQQAGELKHAEAKRYAANLGFGLSNPTDKR